MANGMSPAASGVRNALFVQAAATLLFGLLRTGAGGLWTLATVAVAVAAVGLGAAVKATPAMRTAVLGYEALAVVFGAAGLVVGHYVPGTIIGVHVLIKLAQTSAAEFTAVPAVGELMGAVAPWAAPAAPPGFPSQAPFLPPQPGAHPGGSTVLPLPPPPPPVPAPVFQVPAPPVQAAAVPVQAGVPAEAAQPPAPEAVSPPEPELPRSAVACLTILPS